MILFNHEKNIFTLHTKNTTYQCKVGDYGVLLHLYYGPRLEAEDLSCLLVREDRGFSGNPYEAGKDRMISLDILPQEYPSSGVGDYRVSPLQACDSHGNMAVDFRYQTHTIYKGKYALTGLPAVYDATGEQAETLEITLIDTAARLEIKLFYGVFYEQDCITRAVQILNQGTKNIYLTKALSLCLDIPYSEWELIHFHGRHNMEREPQRLPLPQTVTTLRSSRGTSSHQHNPALMLCAPNCTEQTGNCYGVNLVYSGSFQADVEKDQMGLIRVVMGQHSEQFRWELPPGAIFTTPEAVMSFSGCGFAKLSQNYHTLYRNNLCRGDYKTAPRPILINNWEATYFDFNEEKLVSIAKEAAGLGIELLVMDDGWFGQRDDDNSSLGDWTVNPQKLPHGLDPLVKKVNGLGLKFGIWFEPEMVSENSNLYKTHPDWALVNPGRLPNRSRNQLVLDLSREDVREYLFGSMKKILDSTNIEYVKWDMNRSICNWHSAALPPARQGELPHRYMLGLYELLERLVTSYPRVLFEGCSGGGGRFDPGMLYYHPQIWCSDNTDAVARLRIQYGTSFFYPPSAIGSHVSAAPNHQTGRVTPLHMRGVTAMAGSFGYELDLTALSEPEKREVAAQTAFYKEQRELILTGDYFRLCSPYEKQGVSAWLTVSKDKTEWLLSAAAERVAANAPPLYLQLQGLKPDAVYAVNGNTYTGAQLMLAGLAFPALSCSAPAFQLYGEQIEVISQKERVSYEL